MSDLTHQVKNKAKELGFSMVGIVEARPSPTLHHYLNWVDSEMHGTMGYMAREDRVARRRDLNVILDGVQSIICVGLDYDQILPQEIITDPSRGRISNYALNIDYHDTMTPKLNELAVYLQTESKAYVDTGAILERSHAADAGLGFIGKNSMLINAKKGSFFFLGELLTTASLTPTETNVSTTCGTCTACLTACPTNAFPAPHILDARLCISYLTIENKGWIPRRLRRKFGNWIYGCDICQTVCPFNRFSVETTVSDFIQPNPDRIAPKLLDLLALTPETFAETFANSPIKRIKHPRLLRNAIVATGNWGHPSAIAPLTRLLKHENPLIRGHSAWALGQCGETAGLKVALTTESDPDVIEEIEIALKKVKSGE